MAIVTLGGVSGCGTSLPEAERWHDARFQLWNWTPGRRGWILPQFAAVRSDRWWARGGGSSSIPKVHSVSLVDVSLASLRVWVGGTGLDWGLCGLVQSQLRVLRSCRVRLSCWESSTVT